MNTRRNPTINANLDTIGQRLAVANEALDAELERALGPLHPLLQLAPKMVRRLGAATRQHAGEAIARQLARLPSAATANWEELRRPSPSQLQGSLQNRRLVRA